MTGALEGNNVEGALALKTPWPSITRTIWPDHVRYLETYMKPWGCSTRATAPRDGDGYI
ncbi:hypothetical protein FB451DRAFT_1321918 [Mycena latifolia]|nr:hypothetical protein FB451DRAFT_1321918 [Mycena latifolia]